MLKFFITLLLTLNYSFAQVGELKTGDILLQPLSCWSCSLIEAQEMSDYSHMGMVVKIGETPYVAEAYGSVKLTPLKQFVERTKKGSKIKVRRLDHHFFSEEVFNTMVAQNILGFLGNEYDAQFLWRNQIDGRESLYCSELIYKVLAPMVWFHDLAPKTMTFDVLPDLWDRYFRGQTPRGEIGISPEDFNKSLDFYTVYEI